MEKKDSLIYFFFHSLSKIIILIPIVIIGLVLIVKFIPKKPATKDTVSVNKPASDSTKQTDFNQPATCQYLSPVASDSAVIKDKKIYFERKTKLYTSSYLLSGDCLYIWQKNKNIGEKICGLSTYQAFIPMLLSLNITQQIESIIPMLSEATGMKVEASQSAEIKNLIKSCKNQDVKNEEVFVLPKNVVFSSY